MAINALGYLGIRSDKAEDWNDFASKMLGMQKVDHAGKNMAFRMDDLKQRLVISNEPGDTLAFIGWEVECSEDLDEFGSRLESAGHRVNLGTRELAARRFVEKLIVFNDPDGNRIELVFNPMRSDTPFIPGRPISGFNTGPQGMGHAVLHVDNIDKLVPFYQDILDFKLSDYGLTPYPLYFFHVNGRHHSFAMVGSGSKGFHHFMVEYKNLDDVGQGYDLAQLQENKIAYTLGRHTNDYMTSFYANTPSGFFVESGWGGRVIDPVTWQSEETDIGPSFWGHERLYLPDEARIKMRDMRLKAASDGKRAPLVIDCPWLYQELKQK